MDAGPILARRALRAAIRAVVERFVAAPTHVEHDADVERARRGRRGGARGTDLQQGDVREQKRNREEE